MKSTVKSAAVSLLTHQKSFYLLRVVNSYFRHVVSLTHRLQFFIEWRLGNNPEHFDHQIDLNYLWKKSRKAYPMERGVFSSLAIMCNPNKGRTLDLCCGDGFYTYFFYSLVSDHVIGIDFDPLAIATAKKINMGPNTEYFQSDIRTKIPQGPFGNIVWDAAIEHFTEAEIRNVMRNIKEALIPEGILSGYTIQARTDGKTHLHQHEYEFRNKEDLARFLSPYFKNVQIIETRYCDRTNYYFYATDSLLPLRNKEFIFSNVNSN